MPEIQSAEQLKDSGNSAFSLGNLQQALDDYTNALQLQPEDVKLKAIIYRNRAMVRLRIEDNEGAESDCTKALEIDGADTKALYRRSLAREQLDKIGPAFQDAKEALRLQSKDVKIKELCERLLKANSEKLKKIASTENKVKEMFKLAFDQNDLEQKEKAMTNILVLARDSEEGARRIWQDGKGIEIMLNMVKSKDVPENLALTAVRIIDELIKNRSRAMKMIEILGLPTITRLLTLREDQQILDATSIILQRVFNALAAMDRTKNIKPDPDVAEQNKVYIIRLILELEEMLTDSKYSAKVREAVIDLFIKNLMHMDGGIPRGWSWKFVEDRGLLKLLHVATQIPEQYDYPVSAETRQHMAICLSRLNDDMVFDNRRAIYKERVDQFFGTIMEKINEPGYKVKLCALLITLLQGPVDIGINLVTNEQVTAIMLQMASSDDLLHQSLAAELIVAAIAKYERATTILKIGLPVLKKLYHSENHDVKVRALMGLCKCASAGGDDYSRATMEEEAVLKLAATCKKFLLDIDKYSVTIRSYACEGLSYLSLDADVKEYIVDDPLLLQSLVSLAKNTGALCVYTLASIYVNLTNSFEKPKVDEEMVKLAKFAKHHVPEGHPKDADAFVKRRRRFLIENGAVTACMSVSKTESKSAMEKLARALLAFSEEEDLRGQIISEGGAKLCLQLYKEAEGEGKIKAAHALAKLGCAADPNIVFSGQRMYEVVKPMVELLHPDLEGRSNYDALMTLTNLASVNQDSVRKRILKERAVPKIEEYWFMTDHEELRASAAECLLNLLYCDDFYKEIVKPGTDRLKLWVLYSAEEDERLAMASSGGFVMLTNDKEACKRILSEIKSWPELFQELAMAENPEVQRRCLMAIANMVESDEKVAAEIMATEVFRVLVAITKLKNKERQEGQKEAQRALDAAEKLGLIKPTDRQLYELKNNLTTVPEDPIVHEEENEDES